MRQQEKTEFIGQAQQYVSSILWNMSQIMALKTEYTSLNLGNFIQDSDFTSIPSAAGVLASEFTAALNSIVSIDTYLNSTQNSGSTSATHYQNLYKIKKL